MAKFLAPQYRSTYRGELRAAPTAHCVLLESEAEFRATEGEWRELYARCDRQDPFASWEYLASWWDAFGPKDTTPIILKVYSPGHELIAIFPFMADRFGRVPWAPRVLRLFGHNGTLGPADMSEMPLHLVLPRREDLAMEGLVETVRTRLGSRCDAVLMRLSFAGCDGLFEAQRASLAASAAIVVKPRTGAMVANMPETWSAYLKGLSKSMRDNSKYYPKLLERAGLSWEVKIIDQPEPIRAAVDRLVALHRKRAMWTLGPKHDNHLARAADVEFLRETLMREASQRRAFIAELHIAGEFVASQAFFCSDRKTFVYYSGFDPAYAKFSPITILQNEVFRRGLESGRRQIDFFLEETKWKARYGAVSSCPCIEVFLHSRRPAAVIRLALWVAGRGCKRALRSIEKNRRWLAGHFHTRA